MIKKTIRLFSFAIIYFYLTSFAFAEGEMCYIFSESTIKQMVVDLDKYRNVQEQIELYKQENQELVLQNNLLKENNKLLKESIETYKMINTNFKDIIKVQDEVIKAKEPSFFKQIINTLGVLGLGVLIGLIL